MCAEPCHTLARDQRGLSIIELMVGVVVALLVGLAATTSATMFTAMQRQGIGTGTISTNVATVMSAIKADAAVAGLGFFDRAALMCPSFNLSVGATVHHDGAAINPVVIARQGDSDQLDIFYSTTVESGTTVRLSAASDGTEAQVRSLLPAAAGQGIVLAPERLEDGIPCTLRTVTAVTAATNFTPQTISFGPAGAHNQGAFALAPTYPEYSRAALVGQIRWTRYRVQGGDLIVERPLEGTSGILMRGVGAFRVQYGVSAAAALTTLDSWVDADGAWAVLDADEFARVRALRIGILVRSPQRERPDAAGVCRASDVEPRLFGGIPAGVAAQADWACFRYRSSEAVVPLRNFNFTDG
jgi:type IV pilus assembly protein PilW